MYRIYYKQGWRNMSRYKKEEFNRDQINFIPESYDDKISKDNPVRVIDVLIDSLDMQELNFTHAQTKKIGRKPYDPKDMCKLYVYGYFEGIRSSRKLERECKRNVEVMWLINNLKPDFKTIADFRKDNLEPLNNLFKQFSMLCKELGLYGKEIVAIDGSKFRANNSRRKNYTKRKVKKQISHFQESARKYLELLEKSDHAESEETVELTPEEIQEKIDNAQKRIEELTQLEKQIEEEGEVSITDPDAKHMSVSNNGTDISHNVQIAVDSKHNLVVSLDVISSPADQGQLHSMASKAKEELGVEEIITLADKGYYTGEDLQKCEEDNITTIVARQKSPSNNGNEEYSRDKFKYSKEDNTFTCPQGNKLKCVSKKESKVKRYKNFEACKTCPSHKKCTKSERGRVITTGEYEEVYRRADKRYAENTELYKQRQMIVEPVFGTVKRALGFSYFLLRGNEKVKAESSMHFFVYNLKRVINIIGAKALIEYFKARIFDYFYLITKKRVKILKISGF
jgi:transposase